MNAEHLTVGEFTRTIDALKEDVLRPGFAGVNGRLDTLNGQTRKHGESLAAHDQRFVGLDREIKDLKNRPHLRQVKGGALVPDGMSSRKVAGYAAGGMGAVGIAVSLFDKLLTFMWDKVAAALHAGMTP